MRALKNARNIRRQLEQEVRRAVPSLASQGAMTSARDMDSICKALTAGDAALHHVERRQSREGLPLWRGLGACGRAWGMGQALAVF